jgi:hypothetical protein
VNEYSCIVANACVTVHTFSGLVHSLIFRFGDNLEESMHTNMVCFCWSVLAVCC